MFAGRKALLQILALLGSLVALLAGLELGLLRGRLIIATFLVLGLASALLARSMSGERFTVVAAGVLPVLLGLVLQEMNGTFAVLVQARRRKRRPARRRPVEVRSDERERIAA